MADAVLRVLQARDQQTSAAPLRAELLATTLFKLLDRVLAQAGASSSSALSGSPSADPPPASAASRTDREVSAAPESPSISPPHQQDPRPQRRAPDGPPPATSQPQDRVADSARLQGTTESPDARQQPFEFMENLVSGLKPVRSMLKRLVKLTNLTTTDPVIAKYVTGLRLTHEQFPRSVRKLSFDSKDLASGTMDPRRCQELLLEKVLPAVDNLERAGEALRSLGKKGPEAEFVLAGIRIVKARFIDVLRRADIRSIPAAGKRFDPHVHEAVELVDGRDLAPDHVAAVHQRGYRLHSQLLRPARVVVARGTSQR